MRRIVASLITLLFIASGFCQNQVQPKIMVVPLLKGNQNLEIDTNAKIAIAKIQDALDARGYKTIDFSARLKTLQSQGGNLKAEVIQSSGIDVYVEPEIIVNKSESGNSVKVILNAYEVSTAISIASKNGESNKFYTDNFEKLTEKAVENCIEDFINAVQKGFDNLIENGRSVTVIMEIEATSPLDLSVEIGEEGLPISDQIELWIEANAFKHTYELQSMGEKRIVFNEVRIPYLNESGRNYSPNKFSLKVFTFIRSLGLKVIKKVKGNTLMFTIKEDDGLLLANTKTWIPPNSDVDLEIPVNNKKRKDVYALIIGNEDYNSFQTGLSSEVNVDYAENDARIFKEYAVKTLGIPEENTTLLINSRAIEMKRALDKIKLISKNLEGQGEFIFYYAGHGLPEEKTKEPYLIPVDVSGTDLQFAVKLKDVYKSLTEYPSIKVTVFLDACFSGGARNQGLVSARGVKVKPKDQALGGNLIVFSASSGEQTSLPYKDKTHGLFTYFLLKELQQTKGDISLGDLSDHLKKQIGVTSVVANNKEQNPQTIISLSMQDKWRDLRIQ